ncbi:hypothetical protein C8Q78DRAFT_995462 [Trametes maxima]|nr:hypothetical protein C8Q78DRAFT_995462 [Trametes maxima]
MSSSEFIYSVGPLLGVVHHSLRECDYCRKSGSELLELRRCAKCRTSFYCSKECQRSAWPKHKAFCVDANDILTQISHQDSRSVVESGPQRPSSDQLVHETPSADYNGAIEETRSIQRFVEAQEWAIQAILRALVYLSLADRAPVDLHTKADEVPAVTFHVAPAVGKDLPSAGTWKIIYWDVRPPHELEPGLSRAIIDSRPERQNPHPDRLHSTMMIPVAIVIDDPNTGGHSTDDYTTGECNLIITHIAATSPCFTPCEHPREVKDALDDLVTLCVDQINQGLCLRELSEDYDVAVPYRRIRSGKRWKWVPAPKGWELRSLRSIQPAVAWKTPSSSNPASIMQVLSAV